MTKETNPLGHIKKYIYNSNKQITGILDQKGQMTVFSYDSLGRLKNKTTNDDTFTYTYDALGRLTTAKNANSDLIFTYDTKGNLISEKDNAKNTQITYTYDNYGNRTTMTGPMGTTTYTYDNYNRLTTITDQNGKAIKYTLDTLGKKTKEELPNGTTTNYQYDQLNQITNISTLNSQLQTISSNIYTYDSVGNKLTKQDPSGTHNYSYDNTYQLINATHSASPQENYAYDPVGNRNPLTYKHSAWNQILEDDKYTYTYDDNGNRTQRIAKDGTLKDVYTWNAENKLIKFERYDSINAAAPITTSTYKYDALGRRIEKNVNNTITGFIYDSINIIAETDANNTITTTYMHSLEIDDPLAVTTNGQTYYYHKDGLGSITAITDSSGVVVQKYEYDSFGNISSIQDPNFIQPYTFTGREFDSESGLYYLRARYYDSKAGKFISKDPIGFAGGDVNLYRYVKNSPINYIDPLGFIWKKAVIRQDKKDKNSNIVLHWKFVGWRVEEYESFWTKYRRLIAICHQEVSNVIEEEIAYLQQWRPIPINVPEIGSTIKATPGGSEDIVNSFADLIEAILTSCEGTEKNKLDKRMKEGGQKICDTLNDDYVWSPK